MDTLDEMSIYHDIDEIGSGLVTYAQENETSVRGLVTELFPYIFSASKRMSTRAISKYLQEAQNVKISAASIAKALREPEKHVEAFAEKVERLARLAATTWNIDIKTVLLEPEAFENLSKSTPSLLVNDEDPDGDRNAYDACQAAREFIVKIWYSQDSMLRQMALQHIELEEDQEDDE